MQNLDALRQSELVNRVYNLEAVLGNVWKPGTTDFSVWNNLGMHNAWDLLALWRMEEVYRRAIGE
jgi:hypothetical protein